MADFVSNEDILTPDKLAYGSRVLEFSTLGTKVVIAAREYSQKANSDKIDLILHDLQTRNSTQLTRASWGTRSVHPTLLASNTYEPENPDYVTFLRGGKLSLISLQGGESYEASGEALPIQSYRIFRDVHQELQVVMEMEVYPSLSPSETLAKDQQTASEQGSGMHFDKLMLRHWDSWNTYQKRNHLFIKPFTMECDGTMRLDKDASAIDLMYGLETDCSMKGPGGGGAADYCISSDGKYIAMACRRFDAHTGQQPSDFAWTTDIPIYLAPLYEVMNPSRGGKPKALPWTIVSNPALRVYNANPVFSPNNEYIAFTSMTRPQYESDRGRISLYHIASQTLVNISEDIDLSFATLKWDPVDNHVLFALAGYRASLRLFRLRLNDDYSFVEDISVLDGDESRSDFDIVVLPSDASSGVGGAVDQSVTASASAAVSDGDDDITANKSIQKVLIYAESTLVSPTEIKRATIYSPHISLDEDVHVSSQLFSIWDNHSPITAENVASYEELRVLDQPQLVETVYCPFPAASNGDLSMPTVTQHYYNATTTSTKATKTTKTTTEDMVQCFYLLPPDVSEKALVAAQSVPLVVIIHGGPQSCMYNQWNYRWNLATFASAGYAVLAMNFHGSSSFGQEFCDSIRHDWGGQPYEDVIRGVDFIVQRYGYIDPHRVAGLGASYGGYMINWLNGHNESRRFRCLVNHAGIFSLRSEFYTTEELFFPEWEFGLPWEANDAAAAASTNKNKNDYEVFSPDQFVHKWETPTLVIHGGKDFRVPETEGIATFTTLQRRQVASEFLYFPDECHWILKPRNSLQWYTSVLRWLRKWLKET